MNFFSFTGYTVWLKSFTLLNKLHSASVLYAKLCIFCVQVKICIQHITDLYMLNDDALIVFGRM